jgi:hypothetical protein
MEMFLTRQLPAGPESYYVLSYIYGIMKEKPKKLIFRNKPYI